MSWNLLSLDNIFIFRMRLTFYLYSDEKYQTLDGFVLQTGDRNIQ